MKYILKYYKLKYYLWRLLGLHTCQCDNRSLGIGDWDDYEYCEIISLGHKPHECKCVNKVRKYVRKGKPIYLCSCCNLPSDI